MKRWRSIIGFSAFVFVMGVGVVLVMPKQQESKFQSIDELLASINEQAEANKETQALRSELFSPSQGGEARFSEADIDTELITGSIQPASESASSGGLKIWDPLVEAVTLAKEPGLESIQKEHANTAALDNGTRVEVLDEANDPIIPHISWIKVKATSGDQKGLEGWIIGSKLLN